MSIFLISTLAAFIPICIYILFVWWLDRYEREPFRYIVITFILGAVISAGLSYVGNTFMGILSSVFLTPSGSEYLSSSIIAPMIEETNKGLVIIVFAWLSREFDNVTDGLLYGAVVGLGFAFAENVLYFNRIYENSGQFAWLQNMYVRGFFLCGVHATATAIFGGAIGYARFTNWREKIVIALMGLGLAVMVHSFWNSILTAASFSGDQLLALLPFFFLPLLMLFIFLLFQESLSRESQLIEEELMDEADLGTLPKEHVPYLKSYLARAKSGWLAESVPKDEYLESTTHLAFLKSQYWHANKRKRKGLEKELSDLRSKIKMLLKTGP